MPYERTGYAPWSLTREAGVQSATVDGTIQVPQYIQPVLDTGFVDERGNWKGIKSSDETFFISDPSGEIANGGEVLFPNTANADFIDMTGFTDLTIAIKPSNGGNYTLATVMGPATHRYANLSPVNAGEGLKVAYDGDGTDAGLLDAFYDGTETISADKWSVFMIKGRLSNQKLLQFKITNNTGGASELDFAYLRLV